jgi:hypothetical protein
MRVALPMGEAQRNTIELSRWQRLRQGIIDDEP